jgi:hypothetical protein
MSRPKNPRILVRAELDKLKTWIEIQRSVLRPPSKTWYDADDGKGMTYHLPPRTEVPAEEYPENQPEMWDNLAKYMQAIQRKAREIEEYAEKKAFELRDKA